MQFLFLCSSAQRSYWEDFLDLIYIAIYIVVYIIVYFISKRKVIDMMTAKVFKNGRSQAIRLPKECRFSSDEVMVNKIGDIVILLPKQKQVGFVYESNRYVLR